MSITMETKRKERATYLLDILTNNLVAGARSEINIGRALSEFKREKFYKLFNFDTFNSWLQDFETKGLSFSKARYLMKIADGLDQLGIAQDRVEYLGTSRLREIFAWSVKTHEVKILDLLTCAKDLTLEDITRITRKRQATNRRPCAKLIRICNIENVKIIYEAMDYIRLNGKQVSDEQALADICTCFLALKNSL